MNSLSVPFPPRSLSPNLCKSRTCQLLRPHNAQLRSFAWRRILTRYHYNIRCSITRQKLLEMKNMCFVLEQTEMLWLWIPVHCKFLRLWVAVPHFEVFMSHFFLTWTQRFIHRSKKKLEDRASWVCNCSLLKLCTTEALSPRSCLLDYSSLTWKKEDEDTFSDKLPNSSLLVLLLFYWH